MNFLEFKPQTKLTGNGIRVDEYCGTETVGGFTYHTYQTTKIDRSTGNEISSAKLASTISPEELEVDSNGMLVDSVNRLSRTSEKTGKAGWIVKAGQSFNLPEGYGF